MPPRDIQHNPRLLREEARFTARVSDSISDYGAVPGMHHISARLTKNARRPRTQHGDRRLAEKREQDKGDQ